ncbi:MAG: transglycosylase domain-containing protein, partial [Patescibacteria group bacterium]|nr:transglycosylase domain-containing protein [Patescibacteria group bacterium]
MGKSKKRVIKAPQFYYKRIIKTLKAGLNRMTSKLRKNMKNLQKKQSKIIKSVKKRSTKLSKKFRKFFKKKSKKFDKTKKKIVKIVKKESKKFAKESIFFQLFFKKKKSFIRKIGFWFKKIKKRLSKIATKKQPSLFPIHQFKKRSYFKKLFAAIIDQGNFKYYLSVLITGLIIGLAVFIYNFVFKDLPSAIDLTEKEQIVTTRILDRNGRLLYRIYKDENRTIVPLEEIPQDMINATIAIEDKDFYQHHGFSLKGISRAFLNNVKGEDTQGGSTITQQLVKNRLLDNQRTIRRKLRELLLAVLVEGIYSKNEILEMYLNEVPYGGSTYGIEEAAWKYFGKPAKDLTLGESSMLAGLPAAPSVYTPFGSNPELSKRRQEGVLRRMVEDSFITIEDAYHARNQELKFSKNIIDIKAPHFVMYVKKLLAERYGEDMLQQGGLEVRTTLDLNLQQQTEKIVLSEVERLVGLNVSNGAALV